MENYKSRVLNSNPPHPVAVGDHPLPAASGERGRGEGFGILNFRRRRQGGYIALVALLVVAAVALTIGIAISLAGIEEIQLSFGKSQAAKAKNLASACLEEGLEHLRKSWADYSTSLSVDGNSCIINIVTSGSSATLTAEGTVDIYTQKVQIQVDNNLEVIAWQEE